MQELIEPSSFNNVYLGKIIKELELDLSSPDLFYNEYSTLDLNIMPCLVKQANIKYPMLNLKFVKNADDFGFFLGQAIDDRVESARFIINLGHGKIHFAVLDYKVVDDDKSLILFEPTALKSTWPEQQKKPSGLSRVPRVPVTCFSGPVELAKTTKKTIDEFKNGKMHSCYFSVVEMDIQRSTTECGIFSLSLAKKMFKESDKLERIHKDNIKGSLCERDGYLSYNKLDLYLPATFYKHTQGKKRLGEYLSLHPDSVGQEVNKNNETLDGRFAKNTIFSSGKPMSISAHKKRIYEYRALLNI